MSSKKGKTSVASEKRMQHVIIKADPCCRCCGPSWSCCNRLLHVIIMDDTLSELRVFCLVSRLYYCCMTYNVAGFTANQSQITMVELVAVRLWHFRPFRHRVVSCAGNFDPPCCLSRTNNLLVM